MCARYIRIHNLAVNVYTNISTLMVNWGPESLVSLLHDPVACLDYNWRLSHPGESPFSLSRPSWASF